MSVETPERIWIESEGGCPYFYHEEELPDVGSPITEYVRADKLEELLKKQEELSAEVERVRDGNRYAHLEQIAIKLVSKVEAALAERDKEVAELREALRDIVDTGGISVGNAAINHMITINYMVSIARRALEGDGNVAMV